ncbi:pentatricopeptide repeat-containing protein At5g66520-like [Magnolia sinica]|uniref:pentatricopeptide repeat-containing protein At5g66520-like n=1 Tax=Magnolia sinica TaxID=86752 RepID=UPI0026592319|nr:pentatricopeptide repeat-containing protein At5g66520-like [Magnolia sinica]
MSRRFYKSTPLFCKKFLHLSHSKRNAKNPFPPPPQPDLPYLSLLERCRNMTELKEIHAQFITLGLVRYTYITSRILAFCAISDNGDLDYAFHLFNRIELPTIFNWNIMIKGYSKSSEPKKGLLIFIRMRAERVEPNMHTFPFVIKACVDLCSLSEIHGQIMKFGFDLDVYVVSSLIKCYLKCGGVDLARRVFDRSPNKNIVSWTSLISGYCSLGLVDDARHVFNEMPERNDVSWSAMISGYVQNECFDEAIGLFRKLRGQMNVKPNQSILVSVLNACAGLGASEEGKWVHSYMDENGIDYGLELGTALVDFYSKCGCVESAQKVFYKMPRKDVMAWSAMIMGLAINGHSDLALAVFAEMERSGTKPNEITFISILSACNHGGLVDQGWDCFKLMIHVYGISPMIEHYGCMVDLLGRAGHLADAEQLISSMPMEPDAIVWGALLNGCIMHGHVELGERVGRHLIKLEPRHSGRYVLLANMYAGMGRWEGVLGIRKIMRERRVVTVPGCSYIEVNGVVHRFLVDDKSHSQSNDVYKMLNELNMELVSSSNGRIMTGSS